MADAGARPLHLALQGGGAHGAFTWGVLDALLADGRIRPGAMSGASAGAMNAVVLAQGWMEGGCDGARAALARFWAAVGAAVPTDWPLAEGDGIDARPSPLMAWMLQWAQVVSPGNWNPLGLNPLREIVLEHVDFERLRRERPLPLFVATTDVASGRLRLFREHELTADMLLASACLPTLHAAVSIDGRDHWDGGFAANPPVWPLLDSVRAHDVLLVLLEPLEDTPTPHQATEIRSRLQRLAFQSAFLREMALISSWRAQTPWRLLRWLPWWRARGANARLHVIEPPRELAELAPVTRAFPHAGFMEALCALGRTTAEQWLRDHAAAIGRRSTLDLRSRFADLG